MATSNVTSRTYLSSSEVNNIADISNDILMLAEELIDEYAGFQNKFVTAVYDGKVSSLDGSDTIIDTSSESDLDKDDGYFEFCIITMLARDAKGESRAIKSSDKSAQSITIYEDFSTNPGVGDVYKIEQIGKFPRRQDYERIDSTYYKYIPEKVKQAVIYQAEYIIAQGDSFFEGEGDFESESMDDYSYTIQEGMRGNWKRYIAPKARMALRSIRNIKGKFND